MIKPAEQTTKNCSLIYEDMFNFNQLTQIHLEITNRCQASCPMCNRNVHGGIENPLIRNQDWTLEDFKHILSHEVLDQLSGFYFCGNFGDPIINNSLVDMCRYASEYKPSLNIAVHTNGSARTTSWWQELARALPKNHRVIFALDGLADTHSIYRIGTNYNAIIKNAQAFISAGGKAEWCFIKFKHNEHQVEQARQLANEYGFTAFSVKNSSRFIGSPKYEVRNSLGQPIYFLEPPTDNKMKFIDNEVVKNYKAIVESSEIECYVLQHKEIYIDAYKHVYPCCYLGSVPYTYVEDDGTQEVRQAIQRQHTEYIRDLGGIDSIDALRYSIKDIVGKPEWTTVWDKYWHTNKMITCARSCGKIKEISKPYQQIISTEKLHDTVK